MAFLECIRVYVRDGITFLDFQYTMPDRRRLGYQLAFLHDQLDAARFPEMMFDREFEVMERMFQRTLKREGAAA